MKRIYFVTEGPTDQIVIQGLIAQWLGGEEFIPRLIQPPSSAYADGLDSNLSEGWKGVLAWCAGKRSGGPTGRDEALNLADFLIIHTDADVAVTDRPNGSTRDRVNGATKTCRFLTLGRG